MLNASNTTCCLNWPPGPNFQVNDVRPLYSPLAPTKLAAVQVWVKAPDGVIQLIADVHDSITHRILGQIPTCRAPDAIATAIDTYVIGQAVASPEKGIILPSTGAYRLGSGPGSCVFAAGAEVLGEYKDYTSDIVVDPNAAMMRLAHSCEADNYETIKQLVIAAKNNANTVWPVFSYTLISALRPQIMSLGLTTFPILNIIGPQGRGKSYLNSTYNQLYDYADGTPGDHNVWGLLNCNSTSLGIQKELVKNRGQVITLDELPLSSETALVSKYKKVVAEVLRFAANGSERQTAAPVYRGDPARCQAGMAFTSELPMTAASDLTRMLVVPVTEPMTGGQVSDRANAAGAFRAWITWLMPHLDEELNQLGKRLAALPGGKTARTDTTKALLRWATELFFRFALEEKVIDRGLYSSALQVTSRVFDSLLDAQERRVSQIQIPPPEGNLSWYILKAYRGEEFLVVSSRKELRDDEENCIVEDDALCIRTKTLLSHLHKQPIFRALTQKQMTKRLFEEGVLPERAEKKSATKRIHGKRYLCLSFDALKTAKKQY